MERTNIEKRVAQLLMAMYPESEYKALIAAGAIVDLLIAENLITLKGPKTNPDNSSENKK